MFRFYVPTILCTILCLGSMYRLHNQGSEHSAVTNMYSVSNQASRSSTPTPAYPSSSTPAHRDSRDTRDTRSLINSRMSHSHTLPHSLSHHHSKLTLRYLSLNINMMIPLFKYKHDDTSL